MKRKTFTILAVMASVIGLSGGFLQGALENRAAAGEIATDNARWVEWASQTPGPPTATPGPTSTPYTRICPPPTADRLTVFCYILEPTPGAGDTFGSDEVEIIRLLAGELAIKHEALRNLAQAIQVARDALQPLADNRPVSGPAQRALVTVALMSLGQASGAIDELEDVARETRQFTTQEPRR